MAPRKTETYNHPQRVKCPGCGRPVSPYNTRRPYKDLVQFQEDSNPGPTDRYYKCEDCAKNFKTRAP